MAPSKRQMGVSLPGDLRAQLEKASEAAGISLAEEIRQRVERTFKEDAAMAADPITHELTTGIANLADTIRLDLATAWYAHSFSHDAFAAAVAQRLAEYRPLPEPWPTVARDLLGSGFSRPEDSPETVGRTH